MDTGILIRNGTAADLGQSIEFQLSSSHHFGQGKESGNLLFPNALYLEEVLFFAPRTAVGD